VRAADFVQSYFDAWNHGDPEAVANHLARDGIYCDIPADARHSQDQLIDHLREFFAARRYRYRLTGDILAGDQTIAFQYEILPHAPHRRAGRRRILRGAEFISLHDDAATSIVDYYDIDDPSAVPGVNRRKYTKSGLTDAQFAAYRKRLNAVMETERPYLSPDITLPGLAEAVGCSVNHLSQIINSGFGTSFFDYLNRYRISYARELLASPVHRDKPILSIAFAAGFNSSSAFYTAFRRHVGRTPARYRRDRTRQRH
jgi:AraC-like DNA-binding protein